MTSAVCSSHTCIERRIKEMGLKAVVARKFKVTTDSKHSNPVLKNVLDSDFSTTAINQKWVGDITHVSTDEG